MTRKRSRDRGANVRRIDSDSDSDSDRDSDSALEPSADQLVELLFGDPEPSSRASRGRRGASERALGQLCREIERTVALALAAARDDALRELTVVAVDPAPDASRVCVTVVTHRVRSFAETDELAGRLERARGELRAEVARSLQRKRTPELRFVVAAPDDDDDGARAEDAP